MKEAHNEDPAHLRAKAGRGVVQDVCDPSLRLGPARKDTERINSHFPLTYVMSGAHRLPSVVPVYVSVAVGAVEKTVPALTHAFVGNGVQSQAASYMRRTSHSTVRGSVNWDPNAC